MSRHGKNQKVGSMLSMMNIRAVMENIMILGDLTNFYSIRRSLGHKIRRDSVAVEATSGTTFFRNAKRHAIVQLPVSCG